jgi:glycosyltransferase involved in cell wall biosynthesis
VVQNKETVFNLCHRLSHGWFRDDRGNDIFEIDNFSFGAISQVYVYKELMSHLSSVASSNARPNSRLLSADRAIEFLKFHYWGWQIKCVVSKIYERMNRLDSTIRDQADVLFIYDVWNTGMIDSLKSLQAQLPADINAADLSFEPRVYKRLAGSVPGNHFLYPCREIPCDRQKSVNIYVELLRRYCQHRQQIIEYFQTELGAQANLFIMRLDCLMKNFYRQTASDYGRIDYILSALSPRIIVMSSDCHKISRMVVFLARRRNIATLVIQHGATVGRHAYVPVYADRIAVWGEISRQWFLANDVPDNKLVITGQPRFDSLYEFNAKAKSKHSLSGTTRPRIVVATSPIKREMDSRVIDIISKGLTPFRNIIAPVMKLHPGYGKPEFFASLVKDDGLDWQIVRHCDLYELLSEAEAVITTQSTVGLEAIALGKSVIIIDLPEISEAIPYRQYNSAIMVRTADDLSAAVQMILDNNNQIQDIKKAGCRFIEDYLYRLDGQSTHRVLELIIDEINSHNGKKIDAIGIEV